MAPTTLAEEGRDTFTVTAAAALTESPTRTIYKLIERGNVRARRVGGRRWMLLADLLYIEVMREVGRMLSRAAQTSLYDVIRRQVDRPSDLRTLPSMLMVHRLAVPVQPSAERLTARLEAVAAADKYVEQKPGVVGGEPVIRGTRVPVYTLVALRNQGETLEAIRRAYPRVSKEALESALLWASANPRRGRPRSAAMV